MGRSSLLAVGVLLAALVVVPAMVAAQAVQYRATLNGASEVPPTTSTATGTFTASLDEAAGTITWTLSVPSITNAIAAHLHQAAPTAAGPIVLNLYVPPSGTAPVGSLNVSGTSRQTDVIGPLAGNFAGFVAALKAGNIYVNVHTTQNPPGEIRGTVVLAQATPGATATATAAAAQATATAQGAAALPRTGDGPSVGSGSPIALLALAGVGGTLALGGALAGRRLGARR
jgi:hypothetical protein